jgi:hypothetical protein
MDAVECLALDLHLEIHIAQVKVLLGRRLARVDVLVGDVQCPLAGTRLHAMGRRMEK